MIWNNIMVCVKVLKNGPSNICGIQHLKNFTWSILEYLEPFASYDKIYLVESQPEIIIHNNFLLTY